MNGTAWFNATATLAGPQRVRLHVAALPGRPTRVRYTANRVFPQCALYNAEGLPALPFAAAVAPEHDAVPQERGLRGARGARLES